MSKKPSFMDQFARARKSIKSWPKWMQREARMASATFPTTDCPDCDDGNREGTCAKHSSGVRENGNG